MHDGEFGKGCDVGMVTDGHGFEDSPDCERISGGINSKGPRALAIGRQANLLQWGFYGAPDRMTESARRAFLNAIVYMRQFDGQVPLVQKTGMGRTWLLQWIESLAMMKPAELKSPKPDSYAGYLLRHFPAELTRDGIDAAALRRWYEANEEFFGGGKDRGIVVDADLAALHLSNRKPEFLDWLLAALGKDPEDRKALALARRYLGDEAGRDAAAATRFITANRPFLFFSDTGGYRWFVDTNSQRSKQATGKAGER